MMLLQLRLRLDSVSLFLLQLFHYLVSKSVDCVEGTSTRWTSDVVAHKLQWKNGSKFERVAVLTGGIIDIII